MIEEWQYELKLGNEKALQRVFSEYYTTLCSIVFQYVKDNQISESIAEDVIFNLWEKREKILPLESFRSYLLRMARNKSIDYLRSQHSTLEINDIIPHRLISDEDIFETYISIELQQLIDQKLKELSTQCQRVFYLSRYENLSYHEISLQLGISENTVKYHIKTVLAYLRKELSPYILSLLVTVLSAE